MLVARMVACMSNTRVLRDQVVITDSLRARFLAKTTASGDCLLWTGGKNPNGYGKVKLNGKAFDAHVVSWRIANKGAPVPVGNCVMHSCNNRQCVNPSHLSVGSSQDNAVYAVQCGRANRLCGESSPTSVLTESIVIEARREYASGSVSVRTLAAKYAVPYTALRAAIDGRTWRHLTVSQTPSPTGDAQ